jgi:hypothetical protein
VIRPFAALLIAAFALLEPAGAQTASAGVAGGGERITSYRTDIDIAADASIHVTETILLDGEGRDIRHGIYREIPTRSAGGSVPADLTVRGVERDGRTEPWRREAIGGGVRIWIGDPDRNVTPGRHSYVIRYTMTRQLGFFPDRDELYWNVVGTDWMFPIDTAETRIRLPRPVPFGQRAFYTGAQGSTAGDARVASERPGEIVVRTTRPLGPHEGLTVAVSWPKGIVSPPPMIKRSRGSAL